MQVHQAPAILSGRYSLERELARGGMGSLWIATDSRLQRKVAVKLVGEPALPTEETRARFEREALVVAKLQSPYVVQIHDYGFDHGIAYIVMELLEGEDLRTRLDRMPWLPLPDVRRIVDQVGKALEHIHAAGIVHRDLKPANVFLAKIGDDELVKVIDFGVVRTETQGKRLTLGTCLLGTPRYMSPEQLGFGKVDGRSDLWSLAVIAYRALTGRFPYKGETPAEIAESLRRRQLVPASRVAPELPPGVDAFFAKALAVPLDERYASVAELTAAFNGLARRVGRTTLQFGTDRRMLISLPEDEEEEGAPATVPMVTPAVRAAPAVLAVPAAPPAPVILRNPIAEVTRRKETPERPRSQPPLSAALDESDGSEPPPTVKSTPLAANRPAPSNPPPVEPAPAKQAFATTTQRSTSDPPERPAPPVKQASAAAIVVDRGQLRARHAARAPALERARDEAPARPARRHELASRRPKTRVPTRIIAGVLVLAAIAGGVAVIQIRERRGRDMQLKSEEIPAAPSPLITPPQDSAAPSVAIAVSTPTDAPANIPAAPSATATTATVSATAATVTVTAAPPPTPVTVSRPPVVAKPKTRAQGDDPYANVQTLGGRNRASSTYQ